MTAADKKKVTLLVLLLMVAGYLWYSMYFGEAVPTATAPAKASAKAVAAKAGQEAQIRTDILKPTSSDVGQKNLFQYSQKAAPKPVETRSITQYPMTTQVINSTPAPPPPPPVPQMRPWRYEGFSGIKGGKILGSISEGGNTYEVKEGDCVMGQYCVIRLTEALIEIEDLQLKRRQSFPRTMP